MLRTIALFTAAVAAIVGVAVVVWAPGGAGAQTTTTIQVGDLWFCDSSFQNGVCETTVTVGDTVEWAWTGSQPHTTTECGGDLDSCPSPHLWDSPVQTSGTFSHTFDTAGTFLYRCQVHPLQMRGSITVLAPEPTATPTPTSTPTAAASPTPGSTPMSGPTPTSEPSPTAPAVDATPTPAAIPSGGGPPAGEPSAFWALHWLIAGSLLALAGAGLATAIFTRR